MSCKEITYYELTHPQKRIWYIDKVNLGSSLHNTGGSLNIDARIEVIQHKHKDIVVV